MDGAVEAYRTAISLAPDRGAYYGWLAITLRTQKRFDEAIETLRQGIRRRPLYGSNLNGELAKTLQAAGREAEAREAWDDAIREAERELRYRPDSVEARIAAARAWSERAFLSDTPRRDMRRCLEEARAVIDSGLPDGGSAHHYYACACWLLSRVDDAVEACHASLGRGGHCWSCRTNLHFWLGQAARYRGRYEEAIGYLRQGLMGTPWRQAVLGFALLGHGKSDEAVKHLRRYYERRRWEEGRQYPSDAWEEDIRAFVEYAGKLPELVEGRGVPEEPRDLVRLAHLCYQMSYPRAAARFVKRALAADPELASEVTFYPGSGTLCVTAAAYAGRAAAGLGLDVVEVDDDQRAELVRTAIAWLRPTLETLRALADGSAAEHTDLRNGLRAWLRAPDFHAFRDEEALERLPEAERELCRAFWAEIRTILASIPEQDGTEDER
jgi:tetratricopeptide (TPR) repeat protein